MEKKLLEQLNEIYAPLSHKARELRKALEAEGIHASWGWYAFHSVKVEGEYQTEEFPIPVVTAGEVCDLGLDLDRIFLELQLSRERALTLDWEKLSPEAEVYGAEAYLEDFYHPGMDMGDIRRRIEESGEATVCITGNFPKETGVEELLKAVHNALDCVRGGEESHGTAG